MNDNYNYNDYNDYNRKDELDKITDKYIYSIEYNKRAERNKKILSILAVFTILILIVFFVYSYIIGLDNRAIPSNKKYKTIIESNGFSLTKDVSNCSYGDNCYKKNDIYIELDNSNDVFKIYDYSKDEKYDSSEALKIIDLMLDNNIYSSINNNINSIIESFNGSKSLLYFSYNHYATDILIGHGDYNDSRVVEYSFSYNKYDDSKIFPANYRVNEIIPEFIDNNNFKNGLYDLIFDHTKYDISKYKSYLLLSNDKFLNNPKNVEVSINVLGIMLNISYESGDDNETNKIQGSFIDEFSNDKYSYDTISIKYDKDYFNDNLKDILFADIEYFEDKNKLTLDENYIYEFLTTGNQSEVYDIYTINNFGGLGVKLSDNESSNEISINYYLYR